MLFSVQGKSENATYLRLVDAVDENDAREAYLENIATFTRKRVKIETIRAVVISRRMREQYDRERKNTYKTK